MTTPGWPDHGHDINGLRISTTQPLRLSLRTSFTALTLASLLVLSGIAVPRAPAGPLGASSTEPAEFEAFLDEFLAERMKQLHVPGLVFVLVKDGEIFLAKGYGHADPERKIPIIADSTMFRVGSVDKVFTAAAILQLYERGRLDIYDDVNGYLRTFKIEDRFDQQVTFAHLLTHTGGFDDRGIGISARTQSEIVPSGEYLARRMPPRVMPPAEVFSYSNHGYALAVHLVEEISGVPFARYMEENVLRPLGMLHSSFALRPDQMSALARGYVYRRGVYVPQRFDYTRDTITGGLSATATDMAHFMIALLQEGRFGNTRILKPATAALVRQRQFAHHPQLPGATYGFSELFQNGQRALVKSGTAPGFFSWLLLLPERNMGLFYSYNTRPVSLGLSGAVIEHYFPVVTQPAPARPVPLPSDNPADYAGTYRHNRYSRRTIEKLALMLGLYGEEIHVSIAGPGMLRTTGALKGTWMQAAPRLFRQADGDASIAFRRDARRRVTHLFAGFMAPTSGGAYEKLAWVEPVKVQLRLAGVLVLVFLSAVAVRTVDVLMRQRRRRIRGKVSRLPFLLAGLVSVINLTFLVGLAVALREIDPYEFAYGMPAVVTALLVLPIVSTALTVVLPVFALPVWERRFWSVAERVYYSVVTLAALAFILFLTHWNLLGFRF